MTDDDILNPRGYELQNLIGEGAYSKVRAAYRLTLRFQGSPIFQPLFCSTKINANCAIKCIDKRNAPEDFVKKFLPRELEILPRLNHQNIVKVWFSVKVWNRSNWFKVYEILAVSDGRVFIIMDYAAKGDLLRYIQKV